LIERLEAATDANRRLGADLEQERQRRIASEMECASIATTFPALMTAYEKLRVITRAAARRAQVQIPSL